MKGRKCFIVYLGLYMVTIDTYEMYNFRNIGSLLSVITVSLVSNLDVTISGVSACALPNIEWNVKSLNR